MACRDHCDGRPCQICYEISEKGSRLFRNVHTHTHALTLTHSHTHSRNHTHSLTHAISQTNATFIATVSQPANSVLSPCTVCHFPQTVTLTQTVLRSTITLRSVITEHEQDQRYNTDLVGANDFSTTYVRKVYVTIRCQE